MLPAGIVDDDIDANDPVDVWEGFEVDTGRAEEMLTHDAAGNLTYDGNHKYVYDAWGAWPRSGAPTERVPKNWALV